MRSFFNLILLLAVAMTAWGQKSIVESEYWFDGNAVTRTSLSASPAAIPIASLSEGLHTLTVRVKDDTGQWSAPVTRYFMVPSPTVPETATITRYMYWIDNEDMLPVIGTLTDNSIEIDCSSLTEGSHTLKWRLGDSRGTWSTSVFKTVFKYTLPSSGLGTFSSTTKLAVPSGLEAYYCTTYNSANATINVKSIDGIVPANTGVLLNGTGSTTYLLTGTDEDEPELTDNALVAVTTQTTIPQTDGDYTNFGLSGGEFKMVNSAGGTVKANRAYLHILTSDLSQSQLSARGIAIDWDDETTAIDKEVIVKGAESSPGQWYTIGGRKLAGQPTQKGIYIVNGKKVVIK